MIKEAIKDSPKIIKDVLYMIADEILWFSEALGHFLFKAFKNFVALILTWFLHLGIIALLMITLFGIDALSDKQDIIVAQNEMIIEMLKAKPDVEIIEVPIVEEVVVEESPITSSITKVEEPVSEKEQIDTAIENISAQYGMDHNLIKSVVFYESSYDPNTLTGTCSGLTQMCPEWHAERMARLGVTNIFDIHENLLLGIDYLSEIYNNTGGDTEFTLMMYNMGFSKADEFRQNGITSEYASKVMTRAEQLRNGTL